jgi:hypothetical protein
VDEEVNELDGVGLADKVIVLVVDIVGVRVGVTEGELVCITVADGVGVGTFDGVGDGDATMFIEGIL